MLSKLARTPPQSLVLTRPAPPAVKLPIIRISSELPVTIATRRDIMLPSTPNSRKMAQKTSDSLGDLRVNDEG